MWHYVWMVCITRQDGEVILNDGFLPANVANRLFIDFHDHLAWQKESITMYGRTILVPRLVCWYGDKKAKYRYSGIEHIPLPWTDRLTHLKQEIETATRAKFNSVLGNLYRNEKDSMGWHSDNEKELGDHPFIASISLGEARLFKLKHKSSGQQIKLTLHPGSLLIMSGTCQHYWQHCIPKSTTPKKPRINLTFRYISVT